MIHLARMDGAPVCGDCLEGEKLDKELALIDCPACLAVIRSITASIAEGVDPIEDLWRRALMGHVGSCETCSTPLVSAMKKGRPIKVSRVVVACRHAHALFAQLADTSESTEVAIA